MSTQDVSTSLGIIGALIGALVGGLVYYAVMAITGYQIGYIACLVGVASGYGSLYIGKNPSVMMGVLCAVFSLLSIGCAEYAMYKVYFNNEENAKKQLDEYLTVEEYKNPLTPDDFDNIAEYAEYKVEHDRFLKMSPEEQQEYVEEVKSDALLEFADYTFTEYMFEDIPSLAITLLFGFLGISYGYKVGASAERE